MDHVTSLRVSERLERTIQNELIPRLLTSHRVGPVSPALSAAVARVLSPDDVRAFLTALLNPDDASGALFIRDALDRGHSVEAIYLDLLAPTARRLGDMWEADEADFVEVTVALARMQSLLRGLSHSFEEEHRHPEPTGMAVVSCAPGDQHSIGAIMVAEFLMRDGWQVLMGAPWLEEELTTVVAREWYDVVGFSLGSDRLVRRLRSDIRQIRAASRNPNVQVMVGGHLITKNPGLAQDLEADAYASDSRSATQVARALRRASRVCAPVADLDQ
jgi:methanogenic corrinoid protein MtbC1